jgi:hypothetical protein
VTKETTNRFFDELASGLASGTVSRRKALRLTGAALVGGALASIPGTAWAARCQSPRIRCRGQCCPTGVTTCVGTGGNKTCGPCPTGTEACGGTCVNSCPSGQTHNSACQCVCASGLAGECGSTPCCPSTTCSCLARADGTGNVCVDPAGADFAITSCNECPPDFDLTLTICIRTASNEIACMRPCAA